MTRSTYYFACQVPRSSSDSGCVYFACQVPLSSGSECVCFVYQIAHSWRGSEYVMAFCYKIAHSWRGSEYVMAFCYKIAHSWRGSEYVMAFCYKIAHSWRGSEYVMSFCYTSGPQLCVVPDSRYCTIPGTRVMLRSTADPSWDRQTIKHSRVTSPQSVLPNQCTCFWKRKGQCWEK